MALCVKLADGATGFVPSVLDAPQASPSMRAQHAARCAGRRTAGAHACACPRVSWRVQHARKAPHLCVADVKVRRFSARALPLHRLLALSATGSSASSSGHVGNGRRDREARARSERTRLRASASLSDFARIAGRSFDRSASTALELVRAVLEWISSRTVENARLVLTLMRDLGTSPLLLVRFLVRQASKIDMSRSMPSASLPGGPVSPRIARRALVARWFWRGKRSESEDWSPEGEGYSKGDSRVPVESAAHPHSSKGSQRDRIPRANGTEADDDDDDGYEERMRERTQRKLSKELTVNAERKSELSAPRVGGAKGTVPVRKLGQGAAHDRSMKDPGDASMQGSAGKQASTRTPFGSWFRIARKAPHASVQNDSLPTKAVSSEVTPRAGAGAGDGGGKLGTQGEPANRPQSSSRFRAGMGSRRPSKNTRASIKAVRPKHAFGGLNDSSVHEIVREALRRRSERSDLEMMASDLKTVIPYDLQVALFDEISRTRRARVNEQEVASEIERIGMAELSDAEEMKSVASSFQLERTETPAPPGTVWNTESKAALAEAGLVEPLLDQKADQHKPKPRSRSWLGRSLESVQNLYSHRRRLGKATSIILNGVELDQDLVSLAALLSGKASGGRNAFADAAAIASLRAKEKALAAESPPAQLSEPQLFHIRKAIHLAGRVRSQASARDYVNAVGVGILVTGARILEKSDVAASFTALAGLAKLMPTCRQDILNADGGSILDGIEAAISESNYFSVYSAGWETEARVSALNLLGSLALLDTAAGRDFRVQVLERQSVMKTLTGYAGCSDLVGVVAESAARGARRVLAALGVNEWRPRIPGQRGIRVLCIDGGGTRAVMSFEMLKHLKRITGREIHELFDVICGTSTGAIVAASIGIMHKSVEEVEALYRDLIGKIFSKTPVNGPKLLVTKAFYDTKVFEQILRREAGEYRFMDSRGHSDSNMVFVVSSVMSRNPKQLHLFRNYTYPVGHESRYEGTPDAMVWEGMRASSAAPTFFSEVRVNGDLHADGAIVANNPAAVALHEVKHIYPGVPIECLVSLGNGGQVKSQLEAAVPAEVKKSVSWNDILESVISSATSTESVHHTLSDVLPSEKYFRLNPATRNLEIDETSVEQLEEWVRDAQIFVRESEARFEELASMLRPKDAMISGTSKSRSWRRLGSRIWKELVMFKTGLQEEESSLEGNNLLFLPHDFRTD
ncbi:Calcium-independent phospholipase A2-gamma [Porphyridium purpureum]|uniref:Calcium-independent phospholipase A2-gamma n=1 Tax=Porphyridium purpureum TaxID=35688 RepID=A0A5J4YQ08_PORPP|nr:Calcium-independent phospholipase A2-gamma [Porphyridium purpureum]|eukprot:POR2118..scf222_8